MILAGEFWGNGQEELVDSIAGHQLAEKMRTPFGEDGSIPLCFQRREDLIDADAIAL